MSKTPTRRAYAQNIVRTIVGAVVRAPFVILMVCGMLLMLVGMILMLAGMLLTICLMAVTIVVCSPLLVVWLALYLFGLAAPVTATKIREAVEDFGTKVGSGAFGLFDLIFDGLDLLMDRLDDVMDLIDDGADLADRFIERLIPKAA